MVCTLPSPLRHPGRCANCMIKWIVLLYSDDYRYTANCFDTEADARLVYDAVNTRHTWCGFEYDRAVLVSPTGGDI
jgi:hypothetical protein